MDNLFQFFGFSMQGFDDFTEGFFLVSDFRKILGEEVRAATQVVPR